MHLYDCSSYIHNYMTLTFMSQLTDLVLATVFKAEFLVLMDTFEAREFILGQIACTLSAAAAMHPCSHLCP